MKTAYRIVGSIAALAGLVMLAGTLYLPLPLAASAVVLAALEAALATLAFHQAGMACNSGESK